MNCRYCTGGHNVGGNCSKCGAPWPEAVGSSAGQAILADRPSKPVGWLSMYGAWFVISALCATIAAYPPPAGWPLWFKVGLVTPAALQALVTFIFLVWFSWSQPDSDW
jgi:hypothetical protein